MIKKILLKAKKREGKVDNNFIAGVLYGNDTKNIKIKVNKFNFEKLYKEVGEATLIDFTLDELESTKVLIKDIQKDPIKDTIIHLDLYKVDMNKEITADIPLNFIRESKAVKELGGILNKNIDNLEVICLPGNLVSHIDVDLSFIKTMDDVIRIKDIQIPENIKIHNEISAIIASVSEQKEEIIEEKEDTEDVSEKKEDEAEGGGSEKEEIKEKK